MITSIARIVFICLEVVVLFNLLIVVHELGHFLAARWRGLYIEKFGIWFGKPIWKKTINGVEYSLGSLPFGGFVALPQLAPMDIIEGKADVDRARLPKVSALDKIIVAFAGPLFSFLLAVVFAFIVWTVGRPVSESEWTRKVGFVLPDGPAARAGLQAGDEILEVDGKPVRRFGGMGEDSIQWRIVRSEGDTVPIKVKRGEQTLTFHPKPEIPDTPGWSRKGLRQISILPGETPMVAAVDPGSDAEKAGFKPNDLLLAVNGRPIQSVIDIGSLVAQNRGQPLTLTVNRGEETFDLPFSPSGARVAEVIKGSPAAKAKFKRGDRVVAVDGQPFRSAVEVSEYIRQREGKPVTFRVMRDGEEKEITVAPQMSRQEKVPMVGLRWADEDLGGIILDQFGRFQVVYPRPVEQLKGAVMSIVNTVDAIVSPKSDIKVQHMGGPFMMVRLYYMMFESPEGWRMALWFSVILNINLALLNLLPIPVLDGGHIVLAMIEAVRRRPVNVKVLEYVQTACAILIIGFMVYIAFFDVQDFSWVRDSLERFEGEPGGKASPAP